MRRSGLVVLVVLVVSVLLAVDAGAVISTDVLVVLGIELRPSAVVAPERAVAEGLVVLDSPSLTWRGDRRPRRRFLGRVLGTLPVDRDLDPAGVLPPPTADDVRAVRSALDRVGASGEPRLILLVQQHGGR